MSEHRDKKNKRLHILLELLRVLDENSMYISEIQQKHSPKACNIVYKSLKRICILTDDSAVLQPNGHAQPEGDCGSLGKNIGPPDK